MDRRDGDNEPPFDDDFGWDDETVEVRKVELPAPPPPPRRPRRTLASDLRRLRERRWLPVLAAVVVLVVVTVVIVVATTGDDGGTSATELTTPPASVTEQVTEQEPTEPEATEPATTATETPPPATVSEEVTLRLGDQGPAVRSLQRALAQLGFFADEPDGIYGEQTQAAVQAFQESAGLTIDGTAGPETAQAINQALAQVG